MLITCCSVVVVGDVDPARAESLIVKHFSSLKNPDDPRKRLSPAVPPYASSDAMVVTDKEATGYTISVNYPAYPEAPSRTLRDYRQDIIKQMFSTMLNQRLQELTQKENPPFLYGYTSFGSYARGYEAFNAVANVGTGDVKKGLEALAQEVERVKRFGFTQAELERAKKNTLTSYERAYNNRDKTESENYAQEYINHFLEQEPTPGIAKEFEYIKSFLPGITLDEVNAVTSVFRDQKNKFVYVMGPEAKQNQLPESSQLLAMISETEKADIKPYEEKALAAIKAGVAKQGW